MLEDEFVDVLRKAKRGTKLDDATLADRTGLGAEAIAAWTRGDAVPTDDEAGRLARALALDPERFADGAAVRWHPADTLPPQVTRRLQNATPNSNGYLLLSPDDRTVAVVDPAGDPAPVLAAIAETGFDLRYVIVTHRHADHCDAVGDVHAAHPNAAIVVSETDAAGLGALAGAARTIADDETLPFAGGVIRALATPGHTDGSVCFLAGGVVFTGDTLFAGSVGGAYGTHSTYADILESIRTKLLTLPPATAVMPGHGPATTIAEELAHNPFFPGG